MIPYVLRRIGHALVVLWGAITLSFVIVQLVPGDPARLVLTGKESRGGGTASAEQLAEIRTQMGLDRPLLQQYLGYLGDVVTLDWGVAWSKEQREVVEVLGDGLVPTLQLGLTSLTLLLLLGLAGALASVLLPTRWLRAIAETITLVGIAVPSFVLAIVLLQIFSFGLQWFPAFGTEGWRSLVLPSLAIALLGAGTLAQVFARSIREVQGEGHVEVARARGLSPRQVLTGHVLRNASLPVYTLVGILVGGIVSGAAIIETVFARPGIGQLYVEAVEARDFPLIQALIILTGGLYVLVTLVVDLTYPLLDPRIASPGGRARPRRAVTAPRSH